MDTAEETETEKMNSGVAAFAELVLINTSMNPEQIIKQRLYVNLLTYAICTA